ncbi:MAG: EAL domain-containing protein [Pseudomonadales bacterium]|nr:EAL domain-containing protein [Pseudomonadales bacterium]
MFLSQHVKTAQASSARFFIYPLKALNIQQLLLAIFSVLCLVAVLFSMWSIKQAYLQYDKTERVSDANTIGLMVLTLNKSLAAERGFTVGLLVNPVVYNAEVRQQLFRYRKVTDQGLRQLARILERSPSLAVNEALEHFKVASQHLKMMRRQVDHYLSQSELTISYKDWITGITQCIEGMRTISRMVTASVAIMGDGGVEPYGLVFGEIFHTFSETLGLERTILSVPIAQGRPLSEVEQEWLRSNQYTREVVAKNLIGIMVFFPQTRNIVQAQTKLKQIYMQDYQALRTAIINSSRDGQQYSVTLVEWSKQATEVIDAVYNFSSELSLHYNRKLEALKIRARNTSIILLFSLIGFLIFLSFALWIIYSRITRPLVELTSCARVIAKGDFSYKLTLGVKDEIGEVGEALELMRRYLIADRQYRQKAEEELHKLSSAIEQSGNAVIVTDVEGITEYVNATYYKTTGYEPSEVIGRKANLLKSGKTPEQTYRKLWDTIKRGTVWQGELLNKKKSGAYYWDSVTISPVRNTQGEITGFISIQNDISERKAMEERLNFLSLHDELTGLFNQAFLLDRFRQFIADAQRSNTKLALLVLDIDQFKLVNDNLGHFVGDKILIEVARRLEHLLRGSDTLARRGGDEFILIVNNVKNIEILIGLSERLINSFTEPVLVEHHELYITASIGISIWPDDGVDAQSILRKADTAMYQAKNNGRSRFEFFTEKMNQQIHQRLRLGNDLRKAIVNQEFEAYYQPQVEWASGKLVGAEALIRWNHPELGQIPPLQFISIAEDRELIKPIGKWMLQEACTQLAKWENEGHKEFSIAVNVSARQLDDQLFITDLAECLETSGFDPARLVIEITESTVMSQPEKMLEKLITIKQLGVKLALDDFGTGYSSLSYLRHFPFDKLKIDRSFIEEIVDKPKVSAIAKAIIEMAHCLGMVVVAEGVESESQLDFMNSCSCDCDEIQGYLVGRPMPAKEFDRFFEYYLPS